MRETMTGVITGTNTAAFLELCASYALTHLILPTMSKAGINLALPILQTEDLVDAIGVAYLNSDSIFPHLSVL